MEITNKMLIDMFVKIKSDIDFYEALFEYSLKKCVVKVMESHPNVDAKRRQILIDNQRCDLPFNQTIIDLYKILGGSYEHKILEN